MAGVKFSAESRQRASRARSKVPLETRFWAKVNKDAPGGCWEWTGAKRKGHGTVYIGMLDARRAVLDYAHRVVFRLLGREIPAGMEVDHICRNRACCNPDHLRFVPPGVNSAENNVSPFAINRAKTECKYGHPFSGDNLARVLIRHYRRREEWMPTRVCLTCQPSARNHPRRFWLPGEETAA